MYLYDTLNDKEARNFCDAELQMDPLEWKLNTVNRVEIFATEINDSGPDYCEYRVIDNDGKVIAVKRQMGY